MGMFVNTNTAANNAYRNLNTTQTSLNKSLEKLSSGLRINRAADDAAGLAISEGLKAQVGGLAVASRNAQDGINVVQGAEGGLAQAQSILQRLRDLGVQASNDSNNGQSRAAITTEATALNAELDRIGKSTNFNGINLLDGTAANLKFQVGASGDSNSQIGINLTTANVSGIATALGVGNKGATFALTDAGAAAVTGQQDFTVTDGTTTSVVSTTLVPPAANYKTVEDVANALNADAGFASKLVATVARDAAGVATGLNVKAISGGTVATTPPGTGMAVAGTAGAAGAMDFTTAAGAQAAIKLIDAQITNVSTVRATLGATQNRLESAAQTISVSKENLVAAQSRITDTDMAAEMVNYTRSSILSQAGTAMLAQANQSNQGVLSLLR